MTELIPLPRVPRHPDGRVDADRVAASLGEPEGPDGRRRPAALLESSPGRPHAGRYSYVAAHTAGRWRHRAGIARTSGALAGIDLPADPFAAIDRLGDHLGLHPDAQRQAGLPPFTGGLVLALSYDTARYTDDLPTLAAADRSLDDVDARLVDAVVVVDHDEEAAHLAVTSRATADPSRLAATVADAPALRPLSRPPDRGPATTTLPRERYLPAVAAVLEHVAAGDAFQVNLTQRLTTRWDDGLLDLYRALRAASPAAYGAAIPTGRAGGIASISPETFLEVTGRHVRTRPIKGTRPRHADPAEDAAARDDLVASAKDRAENVMVVDMERNDLGRVCRPGTVRVPALVEVEAHPTVWHLVSTVEGELRDGVGYGALLRAAFPCGSVTGTPKIAAMGIIDRLEPSRRGWYCGAIGFLGHGALSTSVAIRTATLHPDGVVDYGAGGGIVADSDPAAEWQESLDKAAAFLRAVGADAPS